MPPVMGSGGLVTIVMLTQLRFGHIEVFLTAAGYSCLYASELAAIWRWRRAML